jgi:hypothetical protein
MKKLLLSCLFLCTSLLGMENLVRNIPEAERTREKTMHFADCERKTQRLCRQAILFAKQCNPKIFFHISKMTINFLDNTGNNLLDLILQTNAAPSIKCAFGKVFIHNGINILHPSPEGRPVEKIIKQQLFPLFCDAFSTRPINHYETIIRILYRYKRNPIYHDFISRCCEFMAPFIRDQHHPPRMALKDFKELEDYNKSLFKQLERIFSSPPTSSIEEGSDDEDT